MSPPPPSPPPPPQRLMTAVFAGTLLASACLLFLIQPMFARMALPLLGGTPAVWAIAMAFCQAVLLAGYAYAHLLDRALTLRAAVPLHLAVVVAAGLTLPVAVPDATPPADGARVGLWLVGVFAMAIGFPFFALSATAPLLQSWFARTRHPDAANPYQLYRASNVGSIGALLLYPFAIEPVLGLRAQAVAWAVAFGLLAAGLLACGLLALRWTAPARAAAAATADPDTGTDPALPGDRPAATAPGTGTAARAVPDGDATDANVGADGVAPPVTWSRRGWWVLNAAVPSALLVAWTNHLTTDIVAAPFLWLPPLILFLLTFVLAFRDRPALSTRLLGAVQLAAFPVAYALQLGMALWLMVTVVLLSAAGFFATAMICHRQLYESRPPAARLTEFYLLMSLGGVLGGVAVSLVAPLVFDAVVEYRLLLLAALALRRDLWMHDRLRAQLRRPAVALLAAVGFLAVLAFALRAGPSFQARAGELAMFAALGLVLVRARMLGSALAAMVTLLLLVVIAQPPALARMRSYFGVLTVVDSRDGRYRLLLHGTTAHGAQRRSDDPARPQPLTYYSPEGGIARALQATQQRLQAAGRTGAYGLVGLGTGSLACYARPGEQWTYYEIDRHVIDIARDPARFSFLSACAPGMAVVEGDARLTLGTRRGPTLDYLLIDAFSSDSIPVHLLTVEAIRTYLSQLQPDGVLVFHLSNRYMELAPFVAETVHAAAPAMAGRLIRVSRTGPDMATTSSIVAVFSRSPAALQPLDAGGDAPPLSREAGITPWTDDFANVPAAIARRLLKGTQTRDGAPAPSP